MSTDKKNGKRVRIFLLPLLTALPLCAAFSIAFVRFGPFLRKAISILIKLVVKA